jgi:hypothetical protein
MGVDWVRKSEERYKHQLQEKTHTGLMPAPLFAPEEDETVTYACHWLRDNVTFPVGTKLTIFQRGEKARIAVMHQGGAVAEVRGEAAQDLKTLFKRHTELHNALPVIIVRVGRLSEPFYVQARIASRKRPKAVQ